MHVLICHDVFSQRMHLKIALKRFLVTSTGSQDTAQSHLRERFVDLLVMSETVDGKLTHALSLLAECRNRRVETILQTPRTDPSIEELYCLLPSLHCLVGPDVSPALIAKLAIAAVTDAAVRPLPFMLGRSNFVEKAKDRTEPVFRSPRRAQQKILLQEFA